MRAIGALHILAMFVTGFAVSLCWAAPDSPHLAQHRELNRKFTAMLAADPAAAMKFAKDAVESTRQLGPYDARRGDAVLFGAEQQAEADAALTELMETWRAAYGERDLRLAVKLEEFATLVQDGMGRTAWAAELLREALKVRQWHPPDTRLAITRPSTTA